MKICPAPWMPPVELSELQQVPLRPVVVQDSSRAPQLAGFREVGRRAAGDDCSFELPRPLLIEASRDVRLHGTSLSMGLRLEGVDDEPFPGVLLSSRAAAVSAWLHSAQGAACRALRTRLLSELEALDAPESLVVEIARRHRFHIESVCREPRVQLRRRRELQLVDRVRQLDAASLRWLARQPGKTIAERAGPRERILAVRRFRSPDTLENQVLLDVVRRTGSMCKQYERLYRGYRQSGRVALVRDLGRAMAGLLEDPWTSEVRRISGIPTPNYALLSDRRYAPIWRLWQRILRQEQLFQSLEAWMPRLVAELVWIGCIAEIDEASSASGWKPAFGGFPPLQFRPEFDSGDFLFGHQPLPPLWTGGPFGKARIDLFRGEQLVQLHLWGRSTPAWTALNSIRPDFGFAVRREAGVDSALLVWTVALWTKQDQALLRASLSSLQQQTRLVEQRLCARVVPVVLAYVAGHACDPIDCPEGVVVKMASTAEELLRGVPQMLVELLRGLHHAS